jgi:hypothetical protein
MTKKMFLFAGLLIAAVSATALLWTNAQDQGKLFRNQDKQAARRSLVAGYGNKT